MASVNFVIKIDILIVVSSWLLICCAMDYPNDDFFFSDEPTVFQTSALDKVLMEPVEDNNMIEVIMDSIRLETEKDLRSDELIEGSASGSGSGSGSGCGPEEGSGRGAYISSCT